MTEQCTQSACPENIFGHCFLYEMMKGKMPSITPWEGFGEVSCCREQLEKAITSDYAG